MIEKIIWLTLMIEIIMIGGRIIFGSMKENYKKVKLKYKIRIHHGYIGIILIGIYFYNPIEILLILGSSLTFSDAMHHFLILPAIIGKTEFP